MQTQYDENVLDYWKLPSGIYILKMKKDDGLDDYDCYIENTLHAQLGSFIVSDRNELWNNLSEK